MFGGVRSFTLSGGGARFRAGDEKLAGCIDPSRAQDVSGGFARSAFPQPDCSYTHPILEEDDEDASRATGELAFCG